jgi:hypothetical protein
MVALLTVFKHSALEFFLILGNAKWESSIALRHQDCQYRRLSDSEFRRRFSHY